MSEAKHILFSDVGETNGEILALEVHGAQRDFIETIPQCMKEAREQSYGIAWRPVAVSDGDRPIGFAMYGQSSAGDVWLDRFMIDKREQGKGYGTLVLPLLLQKIKAEFGADTLYLSVNEKNKVAIALYEKMGFRFIGELDGNDPVMQYFGEL